MKQNINLTKYYEYYHWRHRYSFLGCHDILYNGFVINH